MTNNDQKQDEKVEKNKEDKSVNVVEEKNNQAEPDNNKEDTKPNELPIPAKEKEIAPPPPAIAEDKNEENPIDVDKSEKPSTNETESEEANTINNSLESKKDETDDTPSPSRPSDKPKKSYVRDAHWYVVHTYSGHEAKVAATLKQRIDSQNLADKI